MGQASSTTESKFGFVQFQTSSTPLTVAVLAIVVSYLIYFLFVPPRRLYSNSNDVKVIRSRYGGLGAVGFYANRYNFLSKSVTKDPNHPHHGIAKFNLLGKIVYHIGGTDEEEIRTFANNRDLSFSQGNSFLFAGIAGAGQKGINEEGEMDAEEKKEMRELAKAISPQRINNLAPRLVLDACESIEDLFVTASSKEQDQMALLDLQESYYPLVFRFTVRVMGMAEYASRPKELKKLFNAFWLTQRNSGFWTTILPWIPQPRLLKRLYGAFTLWSMVKKTLNERINSGHREDDYAQDLIDRKVSSNQISRFVIGGLIAGILNTIGTGAYSIAYVGADEKLQKECKEALISGLKRSCESRGDVYNDLTPLERLQRIQLEEWENYEEFIILHLVFKEAIRLLLTNSLNRYYPGPSYNKDGNRKKRLVLFGQEIEDDSYVTFSPPSNLHDSDKFPNPFTFDPYRYKNGQGDTEYNFVAWGVGIHRCTGIRFAKLETIIALAAFLLFTDLKTVNDKGIPYSLQQVPLPDLSQGHWRSPTKPIKVEIRRPK